ncbi:MAG: hypothetical protein NC923_04535 [Candidatus Omnitrophica bacterium]|nr:hypothetical protein [Candidatus Omnitrophota bacterium]
MWQILRIFRERRAQSTMEYALLIGVVIGAFTAMQLYVRQSINARIKHGMDNAPYLVSNLIDKSNLTQEQKNSIAELFPDEAATQYEPYYYREGSSNMNTTSSEGTEKGKVSGNLSANVSGIRKLENATTHRTGTQTLVGYESITEDK